jgi:hypothetical protein
MIEWPMRNADSCPPPLAEYDDDGGMSSMVISQLLRDARFMLSLFLLFSFDVYLERCLSSFHFSEKTWYLYSSIESLNSNLIICM